MASKTVKIPKINCKHCTGTIERELSEMAGVTSVKADVSSKTVTVEWNEPPASWEKIADLLKEIGYPAQ